TVTPTTASQSPLGDHASVPGLNWTPCGGSKCLVAPLATSTVRSGSPITIDAPSGDHAAPDPPARRQNRPLESSSMKTAGSSDTNMRRRPSGENEGEENRSPLTWTSTVASPPPSDCSQISPSTTYATRSAPRAAGADGGGVDAAETDGTAVGIGVGL